MYIYLLIFFNSPDEFLKTSYIDEVIYIKLLIIETDLIGGFTKIMTLVMFYGLYRKINPNPPYINNTQDGFSKYIKHYLYSFFEETSI